MEKQVKQIQRKIKIQSLLNQRLNQREYISWQLGFDISITQYKAAQAAYFLSICKDSADR